MPDPFSFLVVASLCVMDDAHPMELLNTSRFPPRFVASADNKFYGGVYEYETLYMTPEGKPYRVIVPVQVRNGKVDFRPQPLLSSCRRIG